MADPRAIEYIKQQRAFGISDENIKTNAVRGGFTDQEISEAFTALGSVPTSQEAFTPITQRVAPTGFAATPPIATILPVQVISPTAPSGAFVYAGFWRRFVAILLDALLPTVCLVALAFFVAVFLLKESIPSTSNSPLLMIFSIVFAICTFFYYPLLESSSWQATIGKRLMGLRVTDIKGTRISFLRALARYLSKILSSIFFIGYIMAGFTAKKQALHDLIAGTLVLKQAPARVGWIVGIFIVLIGIPSVIFAYALFQVSHAQNNLQDLARINDLQEIETALVLYQANNGGTYPPELSLVVSSNNLFNGTSTIADPVTQIPYPYETSADGMSYILCAMLNSAPTISIPNATYAAGEYCVRSGPDSGAMQIPTVSQNATAQVQTGTGEISTNGPQKDSQSDEDTFDRALADMDIQGTASVAAVSVIAAPTSFTDAEPQVTDYHSLSEWQPVGPIQVVNGAWSTQIPDIKGAYELFLYDSSTYQLLATSTITLDISPLWPPPSVTITHAPLSATAPTITGTAANIKALSVDFDGGYYAVPVNKGTWSYTFESTSFAPGSYPVVVYDSSDTNILARATLTVSE